ncbi:Ankyrin repeat domain-containing protein 13B [Lamellibrachia satsuma]|nr:Ankyrin repeat domain-containing protein 13B [Lamellibrachia satsuma]
MSSSSWKKHNFPIHWLVWHNDYQKLDDELKSGGVSASQVKTVAVPYEIESQDPRGRTPLHLAVTLGHLECTRVLLRHGANANAENSKYWTVVQEAISTGDPEIVQLCLQSRDYQRHSQRTGDVPSLLQKLREAPDFYVEMKWEFTSWVPLMSRICPSDTYKVWKSGANVRIDTTLLGFDNMNWLRGSRSFVFKSERDAAVAMEIDHDAKQVWSEVMRVLPPETDASFLTPADEAVAARLTSPIVTTYIDTDKISFERNKAGIWGWRSDKVETVNGYTCKVFNACNVELVTKTRTEHLTDRDKQQSKKNSKNPLESILSVAEREEKVHGAVSNGSHPNLQSDRLYPQQLLMDARSYNGGQANSDHRILVTRFKLDRMFGTFSVDDADFISTDHDYLSKLNEIVPTALGDWFLYVNVEKTEHTIISRETDCVVEEWRTTKKLGTLLGDIDDL